MPGAEEADDQEQEDRVQLVKEQAKDRQAKRLASVTKLPVKNAFSEAKKYQNLFRILTGGGTLSVWGFFIALGVGLYQLVFGNILHSQILPAPALEWKDVGLILICLAMVTLIIVPLVMVLFNPCLLVGFLDFGWLNWAREFLQGRCPELLENAV